MPYSHAFHFEAQRPHASTLSSHGRARRRRRLTLAGASPASAANRTHEDAVGDVQSRTDTVDEGTGEIRGSEPITAPDNTDTDITRVR